VSSRQRRYCLIEHTLSAFGHTVLLVAAVVTTLAGTDAVTANSVVVQSVEEPRLPRLRPEAGLAPSTDSEASAAHNLVCFLIEVESDAQALPPVFVAKLIWQESRFRPRDTSPKGAEGIAQFMPETAAERGLVDPFDVPEAIQHSASYLRDLHDRFGSLGLAAAAYNAGPDLVADWVRGLRALPRETRDYVSAITGMSAEAWKTGSATDDNLPHYDVVDFQSLCTAQVSTP